MQYKVFRLLVNESYQIVSDLPQPSEATKKDLAWACIMMLCTYTSYSRQNYYKNSFNILLESCHLHSLKNELVDNIPQFSYPLGKGCKLWSIYFEWSLIQTCKCTSNTWQKLKWQIIIIRCQFAFVQDILYECPK